MWIRSAFWLGSAKPGAEAAFREGIDGRIVPALNALPVVRDAKALWPMRREDNPPDVACQVLVEFDTHDDLERMLASEERRAMRAQVVQLVAQFDGTISHIDYEVG